MACPDEIADALVDILTHGLLRIRSLGWNKNPERCAIEADHLHNLPSLIAHFTPERLKYYWEAERIGFIGQSSPDEIFDFYPLWERLANQMEPTLVR